MNNNPYDYLKSELSRLSQENNVKKNIQLDEFLEKEIFSLNSLNSSFFNNKELQYNIKEKISDLKVPINGQDEYSYWLLDRHSSLIKSIAEENNVKIPEDILLGTLPIQTLDAYTREFPNKQKLVVLSHGLFLFLHSMGNIVASFFTSQTDNINKKFEKFDLNTKTILNNVINNKEKNINFVNVLVLYYMDKNYIPLKKQLTNHDSLALLFYDIAELFIVSHEYSHILLDHLTNNKKNKKKFLDDKSELYNILRNWEDEYSADELALQFILACSNKNKYGFFGSYFGVEFLFGCISIIEEIYGIEETETHPSAEMRIDRLRIALKKYLPEESSSIVEGSKIAYDIISDLWNSNNDKFFSVLERVYSIINV